MTRNADLEASEDDVPKGLNWTIVILLLVGIALMVIGSKVGEPPTGELTGRRQIRIWVLWWVIQRGTMSAILKGVGLAFALPGILEIPRAVLGLLAKEDDNAELYSLHSTGGARQRRRQRRRTAIAILGILLLSWALFV